MRIIGAMAAGFSLALMGAQAAAWQQPSYYVSGAAQTQNSTGLYNPYALLRRAEVQAIATEALKGPLTEEKLAAHLRGSEVRVEHLLYTNTLERTGDGRYKLAMTVFTVADRELLDRISNPLGRDLAQAFLDERAAFDAILARYDMPDIDPKVVRMALIGCVILDWDGLGVTAEGNYRTPAVPKPNGDRYQMVLRERAPHISARALYWGSHSGQVAEDTIWVTTFGDHAPGYRRVAFPDLTWMVEAKHMEPFTSRDAAPQLAEAFSTSMKDMQEIVGPIMIALRNGPADAAALASAVGQPAERTQAVLGLLEALQYVKRQDDRYRAAIPVFTEKQDGEMLRDYRALGKKIMHRWLKGNYERTQRELAGLASLHAGVPFRTLFTEIWHPIFGWANYHLVQQGYLHDPYGPEARFMSFVPFVWDARLKLEEGTKIFAPSA